MSNVKLVTESNIEAISTIQKLVEEKGPKNVVIITDNLDWKKKWESQNVAVELYKSIDDSVISEIYPKYKKIDTIIITSPKLIHRYLIETVVVKVNKTKDLFLGFDSNIYILSNYRNVSDIVSHSGNPRYTLDTMNARRAVK